MRQLRIHAPGLVAACLLLAACDGSGDDDRANTASSTTEPPATTAEPTTTAEPATTATTIAASSSTEPPATTANPSSTEPPTTTPPSEDDQDTPVINGWQLDADSQPCEPSDLPGSPGGEAVVPASWAAGNADYVEFVVDGDLRPANLVRDVAGPGNIQVPCDPTLNDGHEITIVAYTGNPGDPGPSTSGATLIVVTTATADGGDDAAGDR